jgi:hypothetical protein
MTKITLLTLLLFSNLYASCLYKISSEDIEANWTAFKTPSKIGVGGRFRDIGLDKKKFQADSIESILNGLKFNINAKSVWTRNSGRDAKLVKYFFMNMKNKSMITGSIKEYDSEDMLLSINMNGVTKEVPMKVTIDKSFLKASGIIDVFDFALNSNLSSINKACDALHKGKTWNDVEIELKVNFKKECK